MKMSGKVISALRASPLATNLSEAELRSLAGCGRLYEYSPGQVILEADGRDERLFVLREGRVSVHLIMWSKGGACGGEAIFELNQAGEPFGWTAWARPDRIAASARTVGQVSLVALDLGRLKDWQTFWHAREWMLLKLYARLQESGICPPNVQGLLKLKHELQES